MKCGTKWKLKDASLHWWSQISIFLSIYACLYEKNEKSVQSRPLVRLASVGNIFQDDTRS